MMSYFEQNKMLRRFFCKTFTAGNNKKYIYFTVIGDPTDLFWQDTRFELSRYNKRDDMAYYMDLCLTTKKEGTSHVC